jgi:hypothetical protein
MLAGSEDPGLVMDVERVMDRLVRKGVSTLKKVRTLG